MNAVAFTIVVVCPECDGTYPVDGPGGIFVHIPDEHPTSMPARAVELALAGGPR